ncbi:uncharacterized protein [Chelonus insularis]|uniref:uncharacterized protein n=1 Tax=Chelonus insularis TaxID=460826 RepID=UPI00158968DC|nr:uncharacterized protein LOC118072080 [Chelonus insularis]XP_034947577.1 uncharacterized protein LOC118072080 [Chelonus insularis]XP_034947578.1 uncharacterized protein LOC118072080 [Chelonus insularis]
MAALIVMEDSGIDSDPKPVTRLDDDILFLTSDSSCSSNQAQPIQRSTTKQLQRKLEARIEQAKRIQRGSDYIKLSNNDKSNTESSTNSSGLIPIQRLPIPHKSNEHHPLVEYWQSDTESEDETTLFPLSRGKDCGKHKQDLTDTFSIEELSEESEDSLNLGPTKLPNPHTRTYTPAGCFNCQCRIL